LSLGLPEVNVIEVDILFKSVKVSMGFDKFFGILDILSKQLADATDTG